jgi:hypothetical protein
MVTMMSLLRVVSVMMKLVLDKVVDVVPMVTAIQELKPLTDAARQAPSPA